MSGNPDYIAILNTVSTWPPEERASLAHALIDSLKPAVAGSRTKPTIDQLVGIARGSGPAPTDEQIEQFIGDARTQKYVR